MSPNYEEEIEQIKQVYRPKIKAARKKSLYSNRAVKTEQCKKKDDDLWTSKVNDLKDEESEDVEHEIKY
jgi:hypothetical protein